MLRRFFFYEIKLIEVKWKPDKMVEIKNCTFGRTLFIAFFESHQLLFAGILIKIGNSIWILTYKLAYVLFAYLFNNTLSYHISVKLISDINKFLIELLRVATSSTWIRLAAKWILWPRILFPFECFLLGSLIFKLEAKLIETSIYNPYFHKFIDKTQNEI